MAKRRRETGLQQRHGNHLVESTHYRVVVRDHHQAGVLTAGLDVVGGIEWLDRRHVQCAKTDAGLLESPRRLEQAHGHRPGGGEQHPVAIAQQPFPAPFEAVIVLAEQVGDLATQQGM